MHVHVSHFLLLLCFFVSFIRWLASAGRMKVRVKSCFPIEVQHWVSSKLSQAFPVLASLLILGYFI